MLSTEIGPWLDASKIDLLSMCPKKFFWRHEMGLVTKGDLGTAIRFGHAIHKALESIYLGTGFDECYCPCPDFEGCAFCKGNKIPRCAMLFLLYYNIEPEDDRDVRTRDRGLELIVAYLEKWGQEPFTALATEVPFVIEMAGFSYIGRVDLIVNYNGLMPVDHKTTRFFGDAFIRQFKLSGQMTGYIRGLQLIYPEENITKAMINCLRITTKIDGESFGRWFTNRTPYEIAEWEREVQSAWDRIQQYRTTGHWPKHAPYACTSYNKTCEYYSLCTSQPDVQKDLINEAFEVKEWEPVVIPD